MRCRNDIASKLSMERRNGISESISYMMDKENHDKDDKYILYLLTKGYENKAYQNKLAET